MSDSVGIRITLTKELHTAVKDMSHERGQSIAYIMREALAAYLERSKVRVDDVHPGWGGARQSDDE